MKGAMLIAVLALLAAYQGQPASCATRDAALPAELAAWTSPAPLSGVVQPGAAVTIPLRPIAEVALVAPAGKRPLPNPRGAVVPIEVGAAGSYGVALDSGAWIDLVRDGRVLESSTHGHGPECSTVRKIVDFALEPGRYQVQLTGTEADQARLLVMPRRTAAHAHH